ncbi:hypothetical protein JQN72_15540 [Phycicoccus sp. CSK15P-2]|uniref:type IV toxin-antitoxin system AbiEi family antitoxin n=1 Tax=Phycicoccus sp. CSK15P-2 TaxID=2807627 RepID=UPI0019520D1F|nr:type IV toxin-antitoxin system AbiEi family antitoxin [Phycicoccus sp. CSK15P-2]MBM6405655.1 hypothetical protein [Phycicoccus sp. CSK15P-2]
MDDLPTAVTTLLARQDGVATRAQLLAAGVSEERWRWHAGRTWRVVLPRVVLMDRAEPRPRQRLVAALLWGGTDSVLAGASAAAWHGITTARETGTVDLLVPRPAASRQAGFARVTRTVLHDPDIVTRGPLRVCSPARAAVDAATSAGSPSTASAILVEAVQRRVATLDDLVEWVHRARPTQTSGVRAALEDAARGVWSRPEAELVELLRGSTVLPEGWANPRLETSAGVRLLTPDLWFDDVALAVMVHSHRYHAQGADWDATVDGDSRLTTAGIVVVGVTPHRIRTDPGAVRARVEAGYEVARARLRPAVRATPQDVWGTPARAASAPAETAQVAPLMASESG